MRIAAPSYPLSREEFRGALRTGHGRAWHQVHSFWTGEYSDDLLAACIKNWSYDGQLEHGDRGAWLAALVLRAGIADQVIDACESLAAPVDALAHWDAAQRCEILKELARAGFTKAREVLYSMFHRVQATGSIMAEAHILELDGIDGVVWLAREYSRAYSVDPNEFDDDIFIEQFDRDKPGKPARTAVLQASKTDPILAAWVKATFEVEPTQETISARAQQRPDSPQITAKQVVERAPWVAGFWTKQWAADASDEDLLELEDLLFANPDPDVRASLVMCFQKDGYPRVSDRWLSLLHSDHRSLARQAAITLGRVQDQRVQTLAREFLEAGDVEVGLPLLHANLKAIPADWLAKLLPELRDGNGNDHLSRALVLAAENATGSVAILCLERVYEQEHCSSCRMDALQRLIELGDAPSWLLKEASVDANKDMRALAFDYTDRA